MWNLPDRTVSLTSTFVKTWRKSCSSFVWWIRPDSCYKFSNSNSKWNRIDDQSRKKPPLCFTLSFFLRFPIPRRTNAKQVSNFSSLLCFSFSTCCCCCCSCRLLIAVQNENERSSNSQADLMVSPGNKTRNSTVFRSLSLARNCVLFQINFLPSRRTLNLGPLAAADTERR